MGKLIIRRKAYTTRTGTRVKATTFKAKDTGKKGRTPKSQQWYNPKVHTGWDKDQSAAYRRRLVLTAHKGNILASGRAMQALANVTVDKRTAQLARQDALYFFAKHKKGR